MSDPRYTDPRYADTRRSEMNPDTRGHLDLDTPERGSSMWTWLAALVAIVIVLGLAISYNRTEEANTRLDAPTTTGAAPATPRPATPANRAGNSSQPTPVAPTPAPAPTDGAR